MVYKGRTVIAFILLAMFASSIVTMTIVTPSMAEQGERTSKITDKDLNKIKKAYELIEANYLQEINHDKIMDGAINGMLQTLEDPYTTYMNPKEAQLFEEAVTSSFQGIGAEVSMEDGKVMITTPIKGAPAEKAPVSDRR